MSKFQTFADVIKTRSGPHSEKNTNGIQVFLKIFVSYSHGWQVPTMHGPIHARLNGTHLRGRFELGLRYCNIAFKSFFSAVVPSLS